MLLKFSSSLQLKSGKQYKKSLRVQFHIYINGRYTNRLIYDVKDTTGEIIKLQSGQLVNGNVINHEFSIRYNQLIKFINSQIGSLLNENSILITTNWKKASTNIKNDLTDLVKKKFEKHLNEILYTQKVVLETESFGKVSIDAEVIEKFNQMDIPTEPEVFGDNDIELNDIDRDDLEHILMYEQEHHDNLKREKEIQQMSIKERFDNGYYDRENIAECIASIKYNKKLSDVYNRLIIRVYEYHYFGKASLKLAELNTTWVFSFFKFLINNGYHRLNTSKFNPFNFDPQIFTDKKVLQYKPQNLFKMLEQFQTVVKKLFGREVLQRIDFEHIQSEMEDILEVTKSKEGQRKNHYLNKAEFDRLFEFEFKEDSLNSYQNTFDSFEYGLNFKLDINLLKTTRDMFCMQIMVGGLRGFDEYREMQILKEQGEVAFYSSKVKRDIFNPLNEYSEIILNDYEFKLPIFNIQNKYRINTQKLIYRTLLKTIGHILSFDRVIPIKSGKRVKIKELFNGYWARKTFPHIMYTDFGFLPMEIEIFTGHSSRKTELTQSYLDTQSSEVKKRLFERVVVPNTSKRKKALKNK